MSEAVAPTAEAVLSHLCRWIVSNPDDVEIEVIPDGDWVRLGVTVNPEDMGRVIGRRGRVAMAIRTIVGAAASKDGVTAEVEFVE